MKKNRGDIDAIHNFIVQVDATNIDKNTIKDFVTQVVAQKLLIKKNTSQGNESYHIITPTEEDLPQPPWHSVRTPAKENFNKISEVEISFITTSTSKMMFLKLFAKIIWRIKGMLMTFLTHKSLKMIYYMELKKKTLQNIVKKSNHYKTK